MGGRTNLFGEQLRTWRQRRRLSQMGLALEAQISTRHLSFLETGRAQPSREMVLLLADHQTIGGYAKIATVISADLPLAGRLMPGAALRFQAVTLAEAEAARHTAEVRIADMIASMAPVREGAGLNLEALYGANLISGVVSGL